MERFRDLLKALFSPEMRNEMKEQLQLSVPIAIAQILLLLSVQQGVLFSGRLGMQQLDAAGLATTLLSVLGLTIGLGLSTSCETLMNQSFGSTDKTQVGVVLQRAIYISLIILAPAITIYLNAEWLLLAVGQDPKVSQLAAVYLKGMILFAPTFYLLMQLQQLLLCQSISIPILVMFIGINVCVAVLGSITVVWLRLGILAAALSSSTGSVVGVLGLVLYICLRKSVHRQVWAGWSRAAFCDWWSVIRIALPGISMQFMEWTTQEVCTFFSGLLGNTYLGAQVVLYHTVLFMVMSPLGMALSATVRVGNAIGAMNPVGARRAFIVAVLEAIVCAVIVAVLLLSFRKTIPRIFTMNAEVQTYAAGVFPLVVIYCLGDTMHTVLMGVIAGLGKQKIAAVFTAISYYLIGLPVGMSLMFLTVWKIHGLWIGLTAAVWFQTISYTVILLQVNWDKEVATAAERLQRQRSRIDEAEIGKQPCQQHQPEPSDKDHLLDAPQPQGYNGCIDEKQSNPLANNIVDSANNLGHNADVLSNPKLCQDLATNTESNIAETNLDLSQNGVVTTRYIVTQKLPLFCLAVLVLLTGVITSIVFVPNHNFSLQNYTKT